MMGIVRAVTNLRLGRHHAGCPRKNTFHRRRKRSHPTAAMPSPIARIDHC
jgi:hypothetical protein